MCLSVCVWYTDTLTGPSQVSKAVSRRFSCSQMRTICFTSRLWMRPDPVNRVRLLSFPPKVTKFNLFYLYVDHIIHFILFFLLPVTVFRDKVPLAEILSPPCSGPVCGPDHPALLSRCTWNAIYRQRVSFSQLFFSPPSVNIYKPDYVSYVVQVSLHPRWATLATRTLLLGDHCFK